MNGREGALPLPRPPRRPVPIHSAPSAGGVLRPEPPGTHLHRDAAPARPRPPPGAGGTLGAGWPPAETTGSAGRGPGRAGGAGRARPSAAGRSRAATSSETCRAPQPQPPRPLARPRGRARPRGGDSRGRPSRGSRAPSRLARTLGGVLGGRAGRTGWSPAAASAAEGLRAVAGETRRTPGERGG